MGRTKEKEGRKAKSPRKVRINYFSDLFVMMMVIAWIITIFVMMVMGVYSTVMYADNDIWCELGTLVAVPLSCGGAIWMVKNSVQHAIANRNGKECEPDFPAVDDDVDIDGPEEPMFASEPDGEEEGAEDVFADDGEITE